MGSVERGAREFGRRITTVPGTHARREQAEASRNTENAFRQQAEAQARELKSRSEVLQSQLAKERKEFDTQAQFQREQLSRQVMRSNRARIRGGIFGDPQPAANLNPNLG